MFKEKIRGEGWLLLETEACIVVEVRDTICVRLWFL